MVDPNLSGAALIRKVAMYQLDNDTCHSMQHANAKQVLTFGGVSWCFISAANVFCQDQPGWCCLCQ